MQPIKRHTALQPISREHHQGLLLCFKIREGLKNETEVDRIVRYCKWFYEEYLIPHFRNEEKHLFPILGFQHKDIHKLMNQHEQIHDFFKKESYDKDDLNSFEKLLNDHIRYEERKVFNEIQEKANKEDFRYLMEKVHDTKFAENTEDKFWE